MQPCDPWGSRSGLTPLGPFTRLSRLWRLLLIVVASCLSAQAAFADYAISPGDVLALAVSGVPELNAKASVDTDGKVILPIVGAVAVAGLDIEQVTQRVRASLLNARVDRPLNDGRTVLVVIPPASITVTVAEYRPIYVAGDVGRPGAIPYRPGLTVRQAVALAGGFDLVRFKLDNPLMELSDLTGESNALWVGLAKAEAAVLRLKAELDGSPRIDGSALDAMPLPKTFVAEVIKDAQGELESHNADVAKEAAYLKASAQKELQRVDILQQQGSKEAEALKLDTADLQRFEDLFKKGAIALPSVSEARRTVLASSTRALQTTVALTSVEREQGEIGRRLERLGDTRRAQLLKDLQDATASAAVTKVKLQAISNKLRFVGAVKTQLTRGFNDQVKIAISRSSNGDTLHLTGEADTRLQPGDVLEIALPSSDELHGPP